MHLRTLTVLFLTTILTAAAVGAMFLGGEEAPAATIPPAETAMPARLDVGPGSVADRQPTDAAVRKVAVGDEFRFTSSWCTEHALRHAQQARAQVVRVQVAGMLQMIVQSETPDELALAYAMPQANAELSIDEQPADAARLQADLALGATVRVRRDGTVLGYRFEAGVDARSRNLLRRLFATLRIGGDDGRAIWTASEVDATGAASIHARRTCDHGQEQVRWQKQGTCTNAGAATTVTGQGRLERPVGGGWWHRIVHDERAEVAFAGVGIGVRAQLTAEHRLMERLPFAVTAAFDWHAPWLSADGAEDAAKAAAAAEHDKWAAELRETSFAAAIQRALAGLARGEAGESEVHEAAERLRWLLRTRPEVLAELAVLLRDASADDRLVAVLVGALGGEGGKAAQQLLATMSVDSAQSVARRSAALCAMFQVSAPVAGLLAAARANRVVEGAPELADTATLLLGALAQADRLGNGAEDPLPELLALESQVLVDGKLGAWLEALGNSGRVEVVEVGARYLRSSDAELRAAAVAALRRVATPEAVQLLAGATSDADELVRLRAVQALHGCTDGQAPIALQRALADSDQNVRLAAVAALGDRADARTFRARLARVAAEDGAEAVRAAAASCVAQLDARG